MVASGPSDSSRTVAPPLAKPATPPEPSPEMRYLFGGSRSDSVTLPPKVAFTGPTLNTTVAVISVGEDISRDWQPGMDFFKISGSLSAAHTLSLDAGMRWLSFICMAGFLAADY